MTKDKIKILYIDDYELDRELVKDALEKEHGGFEITEASNKTEFESMLQNHAFDVVLSDFNIAGFEGLQVLEAVQAYDPTIPVIIVTGTGSEEIAVKAMKQGASDYIIKRLNHIRKLPQTILAVIEKKILRDQRKLAEDARRYSEKKYRALFNSIRDAILVADTNRAIIDCNPAFLDLFGYSKKDVLGKQTLSIYENEEDFQKMGAEIKRHVGDPGFLYTAHYQKRDGSVFPGETNVFYLQDDEGTIAGFIGLIRDITERKRVEEEREKLQSQLIQAQKMESVGRLAGGVAHDYNNMLSVILGYTQLAIDQLPDNHPLQDDLKEILNATRRSTEITQQLLAFARKQNIRPKELCLNDTVEDMINMLCRLIGEDINLSWNPGKGVGSVFMDPSQIDQILANLLVNARDAIGGVGQIDIETSSVRFDADYCADHIGFVCGDFLLLAVSDDGCGMDKEMLSNLFEPFFTTKGVGQGTGLGLATVYGIVKQNKGFINVYSEPQKGTTFRIYLPRYMGETIAVDENDSVEIPSSGQGEIVLIVEDEDSILKLTTRILETAGYCVLTAKTPGSAMAIVEAQVDKIHLLITDVVMPELNGRDLADRLQIHCPALKVLFMSGYTANVIAHRGVLDTGVNFIQKPFSKNDLLSKVRKVLDEANGSTHA